MQRWGDFGPADFGSDHFVTCHLSSAKIGQITSIDSIEGREVANER